MPILNPDPSKGLEQLITFAEHKEHCESEGVDYSRVCVLLPQWAESAPAKNGAKSALVTSDLIVRSDGSVVFLDGLMSIEGKQIAAAHLHGVSNPAKLPWEEYVRHITLPEDRWPR